MCTKYVEILWRLCLHPGSKPGRSTKWIVFLQISLQSFSIIPLIKECKKAPINFIGAFYCHSKLSKINLILVLLQALVIKPYGLISIFPFLDQYQLFLFVLYRLFLIHLPWYLISNAKFLKYAINLLCLA